MDTKEKLKDNKGAYEVELNEVKNELQAEIKDLRWKLNRQLINKARAKKLFNKYVPKRGDKIDIKLAEFINNRYPE